MRKRVVGLSFLLTFSLVPVYSASPPKAGAICSRQGITQTYQGKKYTCIKFGTRLVWNKGAIIAKPIPTSSPTPSQTPNQSPSPTPTISISPTPSPNTSASSSAAPLPTASPTLPILATEDAQSKYVKVLAPLVSDVTDLNPSNATLEFDSEVSLNARKQMISRIPGIIKEIPNIEWIIDPANDPKEVEQYKNEVTYAVQFYSFVLSPKTPLRIYVGSSANFQWLYDLLKKDLAPEGLEGNWLDAKLARSKEDPGFHGGAGGLIAKDGTSVMFFNYGSRGSFYETLQTQISFHEYTHVAQKAYLSGNMSPMLCWMREGYANYIGYNLSTRYSTAAYLNSWYQQFQYADVMPELKGWRTKSTKDWIQWFVDSEKKTPYQCDDYDNYAIGSITWEYIHGTYGYVAVDKFFRGLAKSYVGTCAEKIDNNNIICPGWKKLYLQVFGVTPEVDYENFALHVYRKIIWMNKQINLAGDKASVLSPPAWTISSKY